MKIEPLKRDLIMMLNSRSTREKFFRDLKIDFLPDRYTLLPLQEDYKAMEAFLEGFEDRIRKRVPQFLSFYQI